MKSLFVRLLISSLQLAGGMLLVTHPAQAELTTFAAIGDFGEDNADTANVASMVDGWRPDFIITLGDNRYDNDIYDNVVGRRYCSYLANVNGGNDCPSGTSTIRMEAESMNIWIIFYYLEMASPVPIRPATNATTTIFKIRFIFL
jgi:hypothetical protein